MTPSVWIDDIIRENHRYYGLVLGDFPSLI